MRPPLYWLRVALAAGLTVLIVLLLFGCGPSVPIPALPSLPSILPPVESAPPAVASQAKAGESQVDAQLRQARDAIANLSGDLARWQQRVSTLTTTRDQEREQARRDREAADRDAFLSRLRLTCLGIAGLSLLGTLACGVLAFLTPIAKSTLLRFAIAAAGLLVVSIGCAWLVPWLPTIGVAVVICLALAVLVAGVVMLVRWWPSFAHASILAAHGYQQVSAMVEQSKDQVVDELAGLDSLRDQLMHQQTENRAAQILMGDRVLAQGNVLHSAAKTLPTA